MGTNIKNIKKNRKNTNLQNIVRGSDKRVYLFLRIRVFQKKKNPLHISGHMSENVREKKALIFKCLDPGDERRSAFCFKSNYRPEIPSLLYIIYTRFSESEIKKEDKESVMRLHLIILNGINPCLIERNQQYMTAVSYLCLFFVSSVPRDNVT